MAYQTKTMNEIKQILLLKSQGESIKGIARALSISKNTVKQYLKRFSRLEMPSEAALEMENPVLAEHLVTTWDDEKEKYAAFLSRADYYASELAKHKHITRTVLWEEEFNAGHITYKYSRFCFHLQQYLKSKSPSMVIDHKAGDKLFIDYAGDKLHITDPDSGKLTPCEILLLTMGYSNYTVVIATESQRIEHFIDGVSKGLELLGAIPLAMVCDNLKSAVKRAHRYEPEVNEAFLDMANHYGIAVVPTRARKPKDKAKVEGGVNHVYKQVYARIRNRAFYSLKELNDVLVDQSREFNARTMQDYGVSRQTLLDRDELPLMKALPEESYQRVEQYRLKVADNGHVTLRRKKQHYSVPYTLIGQWVNVLISPSVVKIYHQGECVATHVMQSIRYLTNPNHLASQHKAYLESINPEKLTERARQISPEVGSVIHHVLLRPRYPEQNYKTCQGILSMERKVGKEKLIESCRIALEANIFSYSYITRLCSSPYLTFKPLASAGGKLPDHNNIRGSGAFQ